MAVRLIPMSCLSLIDLNSVHKPYCHLLRNGTTEVRAKQRENLHQKYRLLSILQLQFAVLSDSSPRKKAKGTWIRGSQTTTADSLLLQVQLSTIKSPAGLDMQGSIKSTKENQSHALSLFSCPTNAQKACSSQSLNKSSSPKKTISSRKAESNQFKPNTCIPSTKQGTFHVTGAEQMLLSLIRIQWPKITDEIQ